MLISYWPATIVSLPQPRDKALLFEVIEHERNVSGSLNEEGRDVLLRHWAVVSKRLQSTELARRKLFRRKPAAYLSVESVGSSDELNVSFDVGSGGGHDFVIGRICRNIAELSDR